MEIIYRQNDPEGHTDCELVAIVVCGTQRKSQFNYFRLRNGKDELWLETANGTELYQSHQKLHDIRKLIFEPSP